jgi:hypothetical protein
VPEADNDVVEILKPLPSWREQRDKARAAAVSHAVGEMTKAAFHDGEVDKAVASLRDEHEMTFAAIAEATGITVSIVRARYERAKGG